MNILIRFTSCFKWVLLFTLPYTAFSSENADISFSNPDWIFTSGASYNSNTEELTIIGNPATYEYARLTISLPNGTTDLYLSGNLFLENIVLGDVAWFAPKIKISKAAGGALKTENLDSPAQGSWYNANVKADATGHTEVILEFGFQQASGTYLIKDPKVTNTVPLPTPYSFPYTIPSNPVCILNLISSDTMDFNNDLLSTNSHFSWASKTWGDQEVIDAINNSFPMSNYRFPGGTVGNFYDWTTDSYHNDPSTFDNLSRSNLYDNGFTFDYPGFKNQVNTTSGSATLMLNVIHDDIATATNRLQSRVNDGLDIKWVELGNENFYGSQSYGYISGDQWQVSDVDEYINHTSSLITSLKSISPSTKYTVCINHHDYTTGNWSNRLAEENYYDGTTVHNYNNVGNESLDYASGVVLLNSYELTRKNIETYKTNFGNTPTIITEWGVLGSKSFLGVISAADMFLAILEGNTEDEIVKQAGIHMLYHSDNNAPQSLILMDNGVLKYSPTGAFYSKLYEVFKNESIFKALSYSDEITTGNPGVISRAVDMGDSIRIFSVNKLPVSSSLAINLDGTEIQADYIMESYSMPPELWPDAYTDPNMAWTISYGSEEINLPAYSITVVTLSKNNNVTSTSTSKFENTTTVFPNPASNTIYLDGLDINTAFEILDTYGETLKIGSYNSDGINIEQLNKGVYLIKVNAQFLKFIKF